MGNADERYTTAEPTPTTAGGGVPHSAADMAEWFRRSGVVEAGVQSGEMVPDFELTAASGALVSLQDLLDLGPVALTFTLGHGSRRCRQLLLGLQRALADIQRLGATLVVISPDSPQTSRGLASTLGLAFDLLSDEDGHLAELFGLAYRPPLDIGQWLAWLEVETTVSWVNEAVPLAAAYVIATDGNAAFSFLDTDPVARVEPRDIVETLARLQPSRPSSDP